VTRTPTQYFERLYESDDDPWGFATAWYERRKYALTVASLPAERYRSAFEPGCSIGALTEKLAPRCERLLAVDHMPRPLAAATQRVRRFPHVHIEERIIPDNWPDGPFDLLVLSEICYYFDADELRRLLDRAVPSLETDATVIAVHWSGETDYPLTAVQTHGIIDSTPAFELIAHHVDEQFLLDVWRYRP
jgi:trans-aconitate methyltransferase